MKKTINICDCCGREVDESEMFECFKELRTYRGLMQAPLQWEICRDCYTRLSNVLESERQRLKFRAP